jgi:hypothetical protein
MNIKFPPFNKCTVGTTLILAGIAIVSNMIITSWEHRCIRKTNNLEHKNWKERYAFTLESEMEDDCE